MHLNRRSARDERGVVVILVCVSLVVLGMAAAMAIDLGNVAQLHRHAQFPVDDAAISGADLLEQGTDSLSQIVTATENYIDENWGNVSGGWGTCPSAPSGFFAPTGSTQNCVTFNGTSTATATAINVDLPPQTVPFSVARLGGFVSGSVEASATAVTVPGTAPCALCVLGTSTTAPTLVDTGNGAFTVTDSGGADAGIVANSPGNAATGVPAAQIIGGSGSITAPAIDLVGTAQGSGFHPTPVTGVSPVPDPLGDLAVPTPSSNTIPSGTYSSSAVNTTPLTPGVYGTISLTGNGSATIPPGNYGNISVGGSAVLTLEPGTYFITGAFTVGGSGDTTDAIVNESDGVLLYFTCSANSGTQIAACSSGGQSGGSLGLSGNGTMTLTPQSTGPYANLTVFFDRNNNAGISLAGTPQISGTIYAKSSPFTLNGTGQVLSSLIIVNSATIKGTGNVTVNYDASKNAAVSGTPYLCSTAANNC